MKLQETRKPLALSLFIALVFVLAMGMTTAEAQVDRAIEANIPFQFYAGNAKLPAGKYLVRFLDDSNLTMMEITSAGGSTSVLFEVRDTQVNSAPAKSELTFNKYGNDYFLAKLFDGNNPTGSAVVESGYEKRVNKAVSAAQEHVPAHHRGQQGS